MSYVYVPSPKRRKLRSGYTQRRSAFACLAEAGRCGERSPGHGLLAANHLNQVGSLDILACQRHPRQRGVCVATVDAGLLVLEVPTIECGIEASVRVLTSEPEALIEKTN